MRTDILLNNNDCLFSDGDFSAGASDEQHIIDTIAAFKGWWKQYPLDGVGVAYYQKGNVDKQDLTKNIRIQLQSDGYRVDNPTVNLSADGQLIINPNASL
jgi:hypothetical protein